MPSDADPAIQLYTVRRLLANDFDGTLAQLSEIGFRQVEAFDLPTFGDRLRTAAPRHGLTIPSTHAGIIGGDVDRIVGMASELGIGLVIHPWTDPGRWQTRAEIEAIAAELNAAAARATFSRIRVGYHNHHFELASRIEGRHALEVFADALAREVVLEVDAYWAHAGGADVPALLERLGDRVVALHLKDGDGSLDPMKQVAVGDGVVPIADIVRSAPAALRVVELDDTAGDLLTAIRSSRSFVLGLTDG
jgi:sugar phosphate isomerase/epimerase